MCAEVDTDPGALVPLTAQRDPDALRVGLERWLGRAVGELARPDPGWSCETVIVDRELVVRLPPLGDGIFPAYDLAQQAAVQAAVGEAGLPVALPVRYEPDPEPLGAPFVTMPFVEGPIPEAFTAGDPWLTGLPDDAARRRVWETFLHTIGHLHTVDAEGLGLRAGLAGELEWWERYLGWATDGSPPAALADALAWCRSHRPEQEPPSSLLWGDVRLGNVIFDPDRFEPRAILDWDMTSVGPAEMDLAWFLALEQVTVDMTGTTVSGFGDRDEAIARTEQLLGRELQDMRWYEVFALVRASAVSTRIALLFERAGQRSMFKPGEDPTLNAAIARIERLT
jgi:aminoglycoside phosphotransferase (APT) family kinase protein